MSPMRLACDRCRSQKLRCSRTKPEDGACQRCQRACAICSISPSHRIGRPFKTSRPVSMDGSSIILPVTTHLSVPVDNVSSMSPTSGPVSAPQSVGGDETMNYFDNHMPCAVQSDNGDYFSHPGSFPECPVPVSTASGMSMPYTDMMQQYVHDETMLNFEDWQSSVGSNTPDLINGSPVMASSTCAPIDGPTLATWPGGPIMPSELFMSSMPPPNASPDLSNGVKNSVVQQLLQLNLSINQQVESLASRSWSPVASPAENTLPKSEEIATSYPTDDILNSSCALLNILNKASKMQLEDQKSKGVSANSVLESLLDDPHTLFLVMSCYMGLIQLHTTLFGDMTDSLLGDTSKRNAFQGSLSGFRLGGLDISKSSILSMKLLVQTFLHYLKRLENIFGVFLQSAGHGKQPRLNASFGQLGLDSFYHSKLGGLWQKVEGVKCLLDIY